MGLSFLDEGQARTRAFLAPRGQHWLGANFFRRLDNSFQKIALGVSVIRSQTWNGTDSSCLALNSVFSNSSVFF
jgi:hypothetical protein